MKQGATACVSVVRRLTFSPGSLFYCRQQQLALDYKSELTKDGWIQTRDCDGGHGRDRVEDGLEGGGRTRTSRNSGTAVSVIE